MCQNFSPSKVNLVLKSPTLLHSFAVLGSREEQREAMGAGDPGGGSRKQRGPVRGSFPSATSGSSALGPAQRLSLWKAGAPSKCAQQVCPARNGREASNNGQRSANGRRNGLQVLPVVPPMAAGQPQASRLTPLSLVCTVGQCAFQGC